ncbi:hypothetical protein [Mesorhizobium muleiense]|uniref:SnoaL-like domain-containing protein n=1 Tax=Mesorhizobium muleiense TaxID=1004279 RepID=A0A1G9I555_9HYPH|nr:hypothetical protein [Mesorhizobium muleiense]MCF6102226.1 hypothetical protein [Mesorhizobium muleiense]SDL20378.1 hypothetical protein SAMN05428953_12936 [Mesorhizobium muleiense]
MAQPTENIRDVLQKANDGWNSAFNSGNADAVAALITHPTRLYCRPPMPS